VAEGWVAVSVRPVPGAAWTRRATAVRVSGGTPDGSAGRPRPPAGADLAALLACGDPGELRLVGVDELAVSLDLAAALAVLPGSVRTVGVDGVAFPLDDPVGRACWRLVLAGLAAHVQSRSTAKAPAAASPARASSNTRPTSTGPSDAEEPASDAWAPLPGSAGTQTRWPGQEQRGPTAADGEGSAAIAATAPAGRGTGGAGHRATARGAEHGQHAGEHPRQVGQQRHVDLDPAGAGRDRGRDAQLVREIRGVRPDAAGQLPADRAPDGGRSAVAVPVSPGECPGKGVRGGT
jgi:hypothetical protein